MLELAMTQIRISILALICALSFGSQAAEPTCHKDKDCVLFKNSCGELHALHINELPENATEETKNQIHFYVSMAKPAKGELQTEPSFHGCLDRRYFVQPKWPASPFAKCESEKCVVVPR